MFDFFYVSQDPPSDFEGTYNIKLVVLSYIIAIFASYVALDIAKNLKRGPNEPIPKWWLMLGAFTMGGGIWAMHFIGMEAFIMPMPMTFNPPLTMLSMLCAIVASGGAFFLLTRKEMTLSKVFWGGILIGFGIASMHYIGMAAMNHTHILYKPGLFALSIVIAILASQIALWFMIQSSKAVKNFQRFLLNVISALIMGAAICGMHYVGMSAAVFYETGMEMQETNHVIDPEILSFYVAVIMLLIMGISLILSSYKQTIIALQNKKNEDLILKEAELSCANVELKELAMCLSDREERTRAILITAADGIISVDKDGIIKTSNPAAENLFGYEKEELMELSIQSIMKEGGLNLPLRELSLNEILYDPKPFRELVGITKKGTRFLFELTRSRLNLTEGIFFTLVIRDITERKQSEEKLAELNKQLISIARRAGMAEVATSVLHNVGNVLNSINVSVTLIQEKLKKTEMARFAAIANFIKENKKGETFFGLENVKANECFNYILLLAKTWEKEHSDFVEEQSSLIKKVQHVKHIVRMQQSMAVNFSIKEEVKLGNVLSDALLMNNLSENHPGFEIQLNYNEVPPFFVDRAKLLQILINLIQNAKESVIEANIENKELIINGKFIEGNTIEIQVIDNGVGITPSDFVRIFTFGYTTKKKGHGFGLHSSSVAARELGGSLTVKIREDKRGAIFILKFPYQTNEINNKVEESPGLSIKN